MAHRGRARPTGSSTSTAPWSPRASTTPTTTWPGTGCRWPRSTCGSPRLEALYDAVAARAAELPPGAWVIGAGLRREQDSAGTPTATRSTARRRAARSGCGTPRGTCAWSTARCSPTSGSPTHRSTVPGGLVVADAAGRPTGLLQEQAQQLLNPLVLPYPLASLVDAVERAGRVYLTQGITSVVEAGIGGGWIGKSPVELAAYQRARDAGPAAGARRADGGRRRAARRSPRTPDDELPARAGPRDPHRARRRPAADRPGQDLLRRLADRAHLRDVRGLRRHPGRARLPPGRRRGAAPRPSSTRTGPAGGWPRTRSATPRSTWSLDATTRRSGAGPVPTSDTGSSTSASRAPTRCSGPPSSGSCRSRRAASSARSATGCSARSDRSGPAGPTATARLLDAGIMVPGSSDRPVVDGTPLLGMHDLVNRLTDTRPALRARGGDLRAGGAHGVHARLGVRLPRRSATGAPSSPASSPTWPCSPTTRPPCAPETIRDIEVLRTVLGRRDGARGGPVTLGRSRTLDADGVAAVRAIYEDAFPERAAGAVRGPADRPAAGAGRRRRPGRPRAGARPRADRLDLPALLRGGPPRAWRRLADVAGAHRAARRRGTHPAGLGRRGPRRARPRPGTTSTSTGAGSSSTSGSADGCCRCATTSRRTTTARPACC